MVWQITTSPDSAREMQVFMQTASEAERQKVEDEMRRVTGIDNLKAGAQSEFEMAHKGQWQVGQLHRFPEDPSRALDRGMAMQNGL